MRYETILLDVDNSIATLTLNRPSAMNAFTPKLIAEARHAVDTVAADEGVKALVVRGAGRAFSAGGDLKFIEKRGLFQDLGSHLAFLDSVQELFLKIEGLPVPAIAVVTGYALAGGLELMLACDLALATEHAVLGDQHSAYGILPGGGSTVRLPRRIGVQRALELIYTGRRLTGREAEAYGLVLKAVPRDQLDQALEALLEPLRQRTRPLLQAIKSAVTTGMTAPLALALEREQLLVTKFNAANADSTRGVRAFARRRRSREGAP